MLKVIAGVTLASAIILGIVLGVAGLAGANQGKGEGHTPVTICHNVDHNGVTITVDDDSTYEGHLNHLESGKDTFGPCPETPPTTTAPPTTVQPPTTTVPPVTTSPKSTPTTSQPPTTTTPTVTTPAPTPAVATSSAVIERPAALAFTGPSSLTIALAIAGFILFSLGLGCVILDRKVSR